MNKLINDISFALCLLMGLVTLVNMTSFAFMSNLRTALIAVYVPCTALLCALNISKIIKKTPDLLIISMLALLFYVMGRFITGVENLVEAGTFLLLCNLLLMILAFNVISFSEGKIKFILWGLMFYCAVFLCRHFILDDFNANTVSTFSLILFIYAAVFLQKYNAVKILYLPVFALFIFFAYYKQCRSVMLAEIFFIILFFTGKAWLTKPVYKTLLTMLTAGSVIFTQIWVYLWMSGIQFKIPFSDKGLYTGRETIWAAFYGEFLKSPVFGTGNGRLEDASSIFLNFTPHNSLFNILVSYGTVVLLIVLYMLFRVMTLKYDAALNNKTAKIAVAGLLTVFLASIFETVMISYMHVFLLWLLLVIINSSYNSAIKVPA